MTDLCELVPECLAAVPDPPLTSTDALPGAPYDRVIGDLFYSQLLYPALVDLDVPPALRAAALAHGGPALTQEAVARMHASAPHGRVLHIHDPAAWWPGHPQPVALQSILDVVQHSVQEAISSLSQLSGPAHTDPRSALGALGIPIQQTRLWHWPFSPRSTTSPAQRSPGLHESLSCPS